MYTRFFFIILVNVVFEPANCMPDLLKNLNEQQSHQLDSVTPCVIRMVFLEHSYSAFLDVHSFLNYYENKATFILESIPFHFRGYNTHSKLALAPVKDLKFRICYVIFYFQDQITEAFKEKSRSSPAFIICEYFKKFTVYLRNENPTSINFITFRNFLTFSLYECLENIDTTSLFYRFSTNGVHRIFIKVRNSMRVSSNFKGWDNPWTNLFNECAVQPKLTQIAVLTPANCLLHLVKQIVNITEFLYNRNGDYGIVDFEIIDASSSTSKVTKNTNLRFEYLPYGIVVKAFRFGTVARTIGYDIHSLIKPFDISTWILLFASILSLCIYFRVTIDMFGHRSLIGTHVLSILLEQSQEIVTNRKKLNQKASGLIILWLLLTFLVANAYKGVLFTILTTQSFQVVPRTIQEVIESNCSVWTTNPDLHRFSKRFYISRNITTRDNEELKQYQKLNQKIELIESLYSNLFVAMETGFELKARYRNHSVPGKVMILNPEEDVRLVKEFYSLFSPNEFVLGETVNFLTARHQWIIRRNQFLSSILPILSALMESGIYSRWEHYSRLLATLWELLDLRKKMFQSLKGSVSEFDPEDNILAYLLFKPHTTKPRAETAEPINMEFFAIFLLLFGYCIAFCGIIFLAEKFCVRKTIKLCCH